MDKGKLINLIGENVSIQFNFGKDSSIRIFGKLVLQNNSGIYSLEGWDKLSYEQSLTFTAHDVVVLLTNKVGGYRNYRAIIHLNRKVL